MAQFVPFYVSFTLPCMSRFLREGEVPRSLRKKRLPAASSCLCLRFLCGFSVVVFAIGYRVGNLSAAWLVSVMLGLQR